MFVGRSESAHGPFVDKNGVNLLNTGGTLVLASHGNVYAPGGQSIFTDSSSGKDIFVYHYVPVDSPDPYSDAYATLGVNAIDWSSVSTCMALTVAEGRLTSCLNVLRDGRCSQACKDVVKFSCDV